MTTRKETPEPKYVISETSRAEGQREQTARAALRRLRDVEASGVAVRQSTRDALLRTVLALPTRPDKR